MNLALDLSPESDNLIFMKEMSVTDVARNFAAVIAEVESGEEISVLKGKRQVARLLPPNIVRPNGAALLKAMTEWQAANGVIDDAGAWDYYYESRNDPINWVRDPWEE